MRASIVVPCLVVLVGCSTSGEGSGGAGTSGSASQGTATGTGSTASATGSGSGATTSSASTASGSGADTWASFAQTAFSTYCVECHNPNDPARDYDKLADVKTDAALIRCGVASTMQSGCGASPAPKQFPINDAAGTNPKPSDVTRDRIVAWIDAGMP